MKQQALIQEPLGSQVSKKVNLTGKEKKSKSSLSQQMGYKQTKFQKQKSESLFVTFKKVTFHNLFF